MVRCSVHKLWAACSQAANRYLLCCSISFVRPSSFARGLGGMQILNVSIGCVNRTLKQHCCLNSGCFAKQDYGLCRMMLGNVGAPAIAKAKKARYGRPSITAWQTSLPACHACTSKTAPFLGSFLKAAQPMTRFQVSTHILYHLHYCFCVLCCLAGCLMSAPWSCSLFVYHPQLAALVFHAFIHANVMYSC